MEILCIAFSCICRQWRLHFLFIHHKHHSRTTFCLIDVVLYYMYMCVYCILLSVGWHHNKHQRQWSIAQNVNNKRPVKWKSNTNPQITCKNVDINEWLSEWEIDEGRGERRSEWERELGVRVLVEPFVGLFASFVGQFASLVSIWQ